MKRALITGIAGQDGSYLSEYLLSLGYEVHGIVRRNSVCENQYSRLDHIRKQITIHYGDLLDLASLYDVVSKVKPDEVYNLAAQSHVRISSDIPIYTLQTNSIGVVNLLDAVKRFCPDSKFYQASSSEMFGNTVDADKFQRETTAMQPVSPYGCSKLLAHTLVKHYRNSYKMFAVNGILFNHESPRRGVNFVTNKVVKGAVMISHKLQDKLELGNMDSFRDWGHAKDYVRAMHMMLDNTVPNDFVVSTGVAHSVRELCDFVFSKLGMNYENHVVQNQIHMRAEELDYLRGDSSQMREKLGWKPEYTFESMLEEMIEHWEARCIRP